MPTFVQLWGEELTLQLSSSDGAVSGGNRFTPARRKAQTNNGMREFVRLTECVKKNGSLPLVDGTATYDLETTFTDFWWLSEREGISIAIDDGTTVRYLVEGPKPGQLKRVDKRRLDAEHPGWRAADPGTPRYIYVDDDGDATKLGFYPAPDIASGETWTATVPYVPSVPDMVADADLPFTFSSNAAKRLEPWHMACVHYAAYKLEIGRKQLTAAKEQLSLFSAFVKDYLERQRIPGGDVVAFAHDYSGGPRRGTFAGNGMVDW